MNVGFCTDNLPTTSFPPSRSESPQVCVYSDHFLMGILRHGRPRRVENAACGLSSGDAAPELHSGLLGSVPRAGKWAPESDKVLASDPVPRGQHLCIGSFLCDFGPVVELSSISTFQMQFLGGFKKIKACFLVHTWEPSTGWWVVVVEVVVVTKPKQGDRKAPLLLLVWVGHLSQRWCHSTRVSSSASSLAYPLYWRSLAGVRPWFFIPGVGLWLAAVSCCSREGSVSSVSRSGCDLGCENEAGVGPWSGGSAGRSAAPYTKMLRV